MKSVQSMRVKSRVEPASLSLSLSHTPQGATGVVVTADCGFRTGRTTFPPDSRAWTPSTPTATGWFRTKTCRLMTERTSSGTCTTSTSVGQRSVSLLLPSFGPVLCPLPWDKGQSPFSYLPWACVVSPALGQRSVAGLLPSHGLCFVHCLGTKFC